MSFNFPALDADSVQLPYLKYSPGRQATQLCNYLNRRYGWPPSPLNRAELILELCWSEFYEFWIP